MGCLFASWPCASLEGGLVSSSLSGDHPDLNSLTLVMKLEALASAQRGYLHRQIAPSRVVRRTRWVASQDLMPDLVDFVLVKPMQSMMFLCDKAFELGSGIRPEPHIEAASPSPRSLHGNLTGVPCCGTFKNRHSVHVQVDKILKHKSHVSTPQRSGMSRTVGAPPWPSLAVGGLAIMAVSMAVGRPGQ